MLHELCTAVSAAQLDAGKLCDMFAKLKAESVVRPAAPPALARAQGRPDIRAAARPQVSDEVFASLQSDIADTFWFMGARAAPGRRRPAWLSL